jgi:hypothetical protein
MLPRYARGVQGVAHDPRIWQSVSGEVSISKSKGARANLALSARPTLADLADAIGQDTRVLRARRAELASGLFALAAILGHAPDKVSASPPDLTAAINRLLLEADLTTVRKLRALRRIARAACERAGLIAVPGRFTQPVPALWRVILADVRSDRDRVGLARFFQYCITNQISTKSVSRADFEGFRLALLSDTLLDTPERFHRLACRAWNDYVAGRKRCPNFTVTVPTAGDVYALPWATFPPSLKADLDRYLACLASVSFLPGVDRGPLRPQTIELVRTRIGAILSAAVHAGCHPAQFKMLRDLLPMDIIKRALSFLLERSTSKVTTYTAGIIFEMSMLARYWVKLPPHRETALAALTARFTIDGRGLSLSATQKMRLFDSKPNLFKLISMPSVIHSNLPRLALPKMQIALLAQVATAIEILLLLPLPLQQLSAMTIGRHLLNDVNGIRILIPDCGIRREGNSYVRLPSESSHIIKSYIHKYRPNLLNESCNALFPGRSGGTKSPEALYAQISQCTKQRLGFVMPPQMFRHFAAKHYLGANPGDFAVLRYVLGHRSEQHTLLRYQAMGAARRFRDIDSTIFGNGTGAGNR